MMKAKTLFSSLLAAAAAIGSAGTYSVVGLRWLVPTNPGSGTNGASISLQHTPTYDVLYSIGGTVSGPSGSLSQMVSGEFEYVIHWVSTVPGEPVPIMSLAKYQIRKAPGTSDPQVAATAFCLSSGNTATASITIVDAFFLPLSTGATSSTGGVTDFHVVTSTATPDVYYSTSEFFEVTPGVWEAYGGFAVASSSTMSASSVVKFGQPYSVGGATGSLSADIRLTEVAGQRVQPDI